jgi:hypothetical protein
VHHHQPPAEAKSRDEVWPPAGGAVLKQCTAGSAAAGVAREAGSATDGRGSKRRLLEAAAEQLLLWRAAEATSARRGAERHRGG